MPTKVTKSLITSVDVSQINTTGADAGKVLTSNGSTLNWLASSIISAQVQQWYEKYATGAVLYHTAAPGTGTWTAPAGVTRALVACVGGSAGTGSNPYGGNTAGTRAQGGSSTAQNNQGGGGGTSWVAAEVSVVPGTSYQYSIGTSGAIGSNGTASKFNTVADTNAALNQVIAGGGTVPVGNTGGNGGTAYWNNASAAGGVGPGVGVAGRDGTLNLAVSGAGGGGGSGGAGRSPNTGGGGGGGGYILTGNAAPGGVAAGSGTAGGDGVAYYDELFIANISSNTSSSSFINAIDQFAGETTMFSFISAAASTITTTSGFVMIRW